MKAAEGCTVAEYATSIQLPEGFLTDIGVHQVTHAGQPAVRVPYRTPAGDTTHAAHCVAPPSNTSPAGTWERKDNPPPYGLEILADPQGEVYLVEGEADAQILRYRGFPALGLRPGSRWQPTWSQHLDATPKVYVVVRSGPGVEAIPQWLSEVTFRERVNVITLADDVLALHRSTGQHFPAAWQALAFASESWSSHQRRQLEARRERARVRCAALVGHDDVLAAFEAALRRSRHAGDLGPAKLLFLAVTTRLLDAPVSVAVKGPSSAGKSFLVKQVLRFFPPDAFHAMTAMSDRALIYSDEPLKHRMLVLYEADGLSETASLIVRSLLSEGRVVYETVIDMQGERIEREGPTGLITTTTRVSMHPENETRLLSVTIPDTPERITDVLVAIADEQEPDATDFVPWQAFQEFLACGDRRVAVPFGRTLAMNIPPVSVRLQRDFKALLSLIRAHALLHQESRERDHAGRVVATLRDYGVVRELVQDLMSEGAERRVPAMVRDTVAAMTEMGPASKPDNDGITVAAVAHKLGIDRSSASRRLKRAASLGYVAETTGTKSGRTKRWVIGERLVHHDIEVLPTADDLNEMCRRARTSGEGSPQDDLEA